jgi:hypothetical protein
MTLVYKNVSITNILIMPIITVHQLPTEKPKDIKKILNDLKSIITPLISLMSTFFDQ